MNRLSDQELGAIWAEHYPRRVKKDCRILLSAVVNIIKGNCVILAAGGRVDYSKLLQIALKQSRVPADQFWEIEESGLVEWSRASAICALLNVQIGDGFDQKPM
jgi:hypothetical protein